MPCSRVRAGRLSERKRGERRPRRADAPSGVDAYLQPLRSFSEAVTPDSGLCVVTLGNGGSFNLSFDRPYYLDVLVNGTLIAHGEVVVINDKYGLRMTDVISPSERIKKLG